jgi:hypothetical protein
MASTINASSTGSGGLITTGDASGELALQANGVTKATVNASGMAMASNQTISTANTYGFKNRLINGNMEISQRDGTASVTPTGDTYGLDRYLMSSTASSKYSYQQNAGSVTPPAGFAYYLGITSLSAYTPLSSTDFFGMQQRIEGLNFYDLDWGTANAKTVTLSFWVRSSLTGTFGGALRSGDFGICYVYSYTINAANTWEQKTITIAGPTSGTFFKTNALGLSVVWAWGCGSTYLTSTLNTWQSGTFLAPTGQTNVVGTNGATFYITGLQLEVGSQATSFDFRSIGQELALCQRYFVSFGGETVYQRFGIGINQSGTNGYPIVNLPVVMRTLPTLTFSLAADFSLWNGNTLIPAANLAVDQATTTNVSLNVAVASGLTAGDAIGLLSSNTLNTRLRFSAEL